LNNEFNVAKAIEDTAQVLKDAGMPAEEAKRQAELEAEGEVIELDEEHAGLFEEGG